MIYHPNCAADFSNPLCVPSYRASIVEDNTIADIEVYLQKSYTIGFLFLFNHDSCHGDGRCFFYEYGMDEIHAEWNRDLLWTMMRHDGCSEARKALLCDWEETLYFHCSDIIGRLRLPNSPEHQLNIGVIFKIEFMRTSPQAVEALGITTADDAGRTNLLKLLGPHKLLELTGRADDTCAICLEKFERGDCLICMPCSHAFHCSCLVEWLPTRYTCPMCRYELKWKMMDALPPPEAPSM